MRLCPRPFLSVIAAGVFAIVGALSAQAHEPGETPGETKAPIITADDLPVAAIRQIVRDYLIEHPEVLLEAQQALMAKRTEREAQQARAAVRRYREELFSDPDTPVAGDPEGAVALVEFFDYRCGHCRRSKPILDTLLAENGDLRLVYKEFPILGPESTLAARAALASRAQGVYAAFHDGLMAAEGALDRTRLFEIARSVGLDHERLARDMAEPAIDGLIRRNAALAEALGISATPSFVIGEHVIRGAPSLAQFRAIIADAREARAAGAGERAQ